MRTTVNLGGVNCDGLKCGKATFVTHEQCNNAAIFSTANNLDLRSTKIHSLDNEIVMPHIF